MLGNSSYTLKLALKRAIVVYWLGAMMDIEMLFIFHYKPYRWILNDEAIYVNTTVHVRQ